MMEYTCRMRSSPECTGKAQVRHRDTITVITHHSCKPCADSVNPYGRGPLSDRVGDVVGVAIGKNTHWHLPKYDIEE